MRRCVEVWRVAEGDVVAGGVGLGAHRFAGGVCVATDVGADAAEIVTGAK